VAPVTIVVAVAPFTPATVPALAQRPVAVESAPVATVHPAEETLLSEVAL
jgi:hypothetical protein